MISLPIGIWCSDHDHSFTSRLESRYTKFLAQRRNERNFIEHMIACHQFNIALTWCQTDNKRLMEVVRIVGAICWIVCQPKHFLPVRVKRVVARRQNGLLKSHVYEIRFNTWMYQFFWNKSICYYCMLPIPSRGEQWKYIKSCRDRNPLFKLFTHTTLAILRNHDRQLILVF